MAGFFDDEPSTKKPVPAVVAPVIPEVAVAAVEAPAKLPAEVLTNEVEPVIANEAPLSVVPVEVAATDEKIAEQVAESEAAVVPETVNEVLPVVEGEILEPAASEIVVSEVPVAITATVPESPVAAVVSAPVKQTSEEEEGLIEGIVNTLIEDDDTEGKMKMLDSEEILYKSCFSR